VKPSHRHNAQVIYRFINHLWFCIKVSEGAANPNMSAESACLSSNQ